MASASTFLTSFIFLVFRLDLRSIRSTNSKYGWAQSSQQVHPGRFWPVACASWQEAFVEGWDGAGEDDASFQHAVRDLPRVLVPRTKIQFTQRAHGRAWWALSGDPEVSILYKVFLLFETNLVFDRSKGMSNCIVWLRSLTEKSYSERSLTNTFAGFLGFI